MAGILSRLTGSSKYEPLPRAWHISQRVGSKVIVSGGLTKDFSDKSCQHLSSVVEIFDPYSELWEQKQVKGDCPQPGIYGPASASLHDDFFSFGGFFDNRYFNTLHRLDTKTWQWYQLSPQIADEVPKADCQPPMRKADCRMISFRNSLVVFGGWAIPLRPILQPFISSNSVDSIEWIEPPTPPSFIPSKSHNDRGWTNELHIYNISKGVWSCPVTTGDGPPPSSEFTFTAIDERRAVFFGGYKGKFEEKMNTVFIIDLITMTWSNFDRAGDESWPVVRTDHAACCLNYGQEYPQLLITGGLNKDRKPLADAWILDIDRKHWRNVNFVQKPRFGHSLTAFTMSPTLTYVVEFGGCLDFRVDSGDDKHPKIADTILLQFRLIESSGTSEWELLSVVDNKQRGSHERLLEKLPYMVGEKQQSKAEIESEMIRIEKQQLENEREMVRVLEKERDIAIDSKREAEERMRVLEGERDRAVEDKEEGIRQAEERVSVVERERDAMRAELQQVLARANELQQRLDHVEEREHERLVVQEQAIAAEQRGPSWEVKEDKLEVTDEELGCGGWAKVKVARLKVAAKVLHEQLIYDYHRTLFRREMDVASRVSHPNLLHFLGARLDGGMAILTELMPTSLRDLVNRRPRQDIPLEHILSIAIDVACALNYLHHMTPEPIIHRDLSSANVLLQPTPNGGWLAKVSDYGTANFQSQLKTENPGSPVYTAPGSRDPALQTPKMDIYSFGVLLVEMCTCEFPAPERRPELIQSIQHPQLLNLIAQCLNTDKDQRPTAAQLVDILQAMQ